METPRSPPADDAGGRDEQEDIVMGGTEEADLPTSKPFEHHPRDLLPEKIPQTYLNGSPAARESRPADEQAIFDQKKNEVARKMTMPEMQSKYKEIAAQITERLQENDKKEQEWEIEKDKMVQSHEMEAKALKRMLSALQDD